MKRQTDNSEEWRRIFSGGFTLIELLTVIAILGLLASILVPIAGKVRSSARQIQCASNMRQIGVALHNFANDHDGRLPGIAHSRPENESWIYTLAPYLGNVDEVRISPADPLADVKRQHPSATTYIMNDLVFHQEQDTFSGTLTGPAPNLENFQDPSRVILSFTGPELTDRREFSATNDHTHAGRWNSWARVVADISPDLHRFGTQSTDRTNGSSNYLFADGRVESISASWVKAQIEQGINIANPNGH